MTKPRHTTSTRCRCTPARGPIRRPVRARRRSTRRRRSSSRTPTTRRRSSTWSARATSIRASPTRPCAVLEERIAALEGGVGAIATASGQAALHLAIVTLLGAGSHIVASRVALRRLAQPARLHAAALRHRHDVRRSARHRRLARGDPAADAAAVRRDARQSAASTCSTFRASRQLAHEHGLPLLVDSTFTTPWLMRPFEHGADLVFHSATKFLSGHGVVIGGAAGRFRAASTGRQAAARGKFPTLTEPYAGFHDMVFSRGVDDRGVPAARAPRGHPRLRRLHGAVHRVPDPAGHRDAAAAHGAPRREHARGRRVPARRTRWSRDVGYPELPDHPDHALAQTAAAARLRRRVQLRPRGHARRRGGASSRRCASSRTSPTSATRNRS